MTIATVVVTYRPERAVLEKILVYAGSHAFLIVVDNTDTEDLSDAFAGWADTELEYIGLAANLGIGKALNVAAERALELGYTWMLMLDQDSSLSETAYRALERQVELHGETDVAIIAANQVSRARKSLQAATRSEIAQVDRLMTSGSVLNLNAYRKCGGFEERLFIDHVDHEYCLRLQKAGYRTLQCQGIILDHSLGELSEARIFGRTVSYTRHAPFRLYYFVRNGLYVGTKFFWYRPTFLLWAIREMLKHLVKILLFQDRKLLRLRMFHWGYTDFFLGRHEAGHTIRRNFPR